MVDTVKLPIFLCIVSAFAGSAIVFTYKQTAGKIEAMKTDKQQKAVSAIFPRGVTLTENKFPDTPHTTYWMAKKNTATVGYAFHLVKRGYAGEISFMVGIACDGTILGLKILSQEEVPGRGARIEEIIPDTYIWNGLFSKIKPADPWFTGQFKGINILKPIRITVAEEWHRLSDRQKKAFTEDNMITAVTGATVSTNAICSGIREYAARYLNKIPELNREQSALTGDPAHKDSTCLRKN